MALGRNRDSHKDDPAAHMERVYAALDAGDEASLEALLRDGARRFPHDAEVAVQLATILRLKESDEAEAHLRRAAELAAGDPSYLTWVAEQMFLFGDLHAAQELIREALRLMPEDFEHAGDLAYVTGRLAVEAGRDDHAEPLLEDAFTHTPRADHGYALAEFHAARGRLDRARGIVAQALEHSPDDGWLLKLQAELAARADD